MSEMRGIIVDLSDGSKRVELYGCPGPAIGHTETPEEVFGLIRSMYREASRPVGTGVQAVSYSQLNGLQEASDATCDWPCNSDYACIIRYDPDDCRVWTTEASGNQLAGKFDVFRTANHVSPAKIAKAIEDHLNGRWAG